MSSFSDRIRSRRSIRKFQDQDIPMEEIQDIIRTAASAPSACNSQCWSFVAVRDKKVLDSMADAISNKLEEILGAGSGQLPENYMASKKKAVNFFTKAPAVIAVFMTPWAYYDAAMLSVLGSKVGTREALSDFFGYPDILSLGAAIQNLLLAVHEKGYGACWMNDPAVAGEEIRQILGMPEDHKFISLIPVGIPAYTPREKALKPLDKVLKEM